MHRERADEADAAWLQWVTWHPKGNILLGGGSDGVCYMWLAINGKPMNIFAGHGDALTAGCFTPDGKTIVTASADASVRVWNPKTTECTALLQGPLFHQGSVTSIACHPTTTTLASGGEDGKIFLSNLGSGKIHASMTHRDTVESVAFAAGYARPRLRTS